MRKLWTDNENMLLSTHYAHSTKEELEKLFPTRSYDAIKLHASKLGLKKQTGLFQRKNNVEILLNGSLESYYWIGFILADGHISNNKRLAVKLSINDKEHLKKLAKYINTTITVDDNKVYLSAQHYEAIPKLCNIFDIKSNKTENPPELSEYILTDKQMLSLIIGFIDGDGNITNLVNRPDLNLRIKVHGSWLNNLIFIEDFLYKKFPNFKFVKQLSKINNQGYAQLTISNNKIIKNLKNFIEDESLPVLNRKWDKVKSPIF